MALILAHKDGNGGGAGDGGCDDGGGGGGGGAGAGAGDGGCGGGGGGGGGGVVMVMVMVMMMMMNIRAGQSQCINTRQPHCSISKASHLRLQRLFCLILHQPPSTPPSKCNHLVSCHMLPQ